ACLDQGVQFLYASSAATYGASDTCRLARNTPDADLAEAACDADLSRERIGALREATYPATPAPNPAAAPAKP
ncbi:hypothetical protein ACQCQ7_26085, partial [Ralstonia pseudosolanacearum]